jgi:hypothetical protein
MVDAKRLRELLFYDPKTGIFTWKVDRNNRIKKGSVAGTQSGDGYVNIFVDRKNYRAHRLAWLYMYNEQPPAIIDHINGVRDDNRIENLREATNSLNMHWAKKPNKDSGYYGVNKNGDRWVVYVAGKNKGSFVCKVLAAKVYNREAYRVYGDNALLNDVPFSKPQEPVEQVDVVSNSVRHKRRNKESGYYGVSRNKKGTWSVSVAGKRLGNYTCKELASKVYDREAKKAFGDTYPYINH